jgi:predicted acetyltransferase
MNELNTRIIAVQEPGQMETLRNLMPLYLHDLSAYTPELQPNDQGLFEYEGMHLYAEDERLKAFLIVQDNSVAGFLLLNEPPYTFKEVDYCVNELFILNNYRQKGLARTAIQLVFNQFPGKYVIFQLADNARALSFWRKIYEENNISYTEKEELYDGELCNFQHFEIGTK